MFSMWSLLNFREYMLQHIFGTFPGCGEVKGIGIVTDVVIPGVILRH
jgi:hypothetical protein